MYTSTFGGNAVKPADVSYDALSISANATLNWPSTGQSPSTSSIMDITATVAALSVTLPSALRVSPGETITIKNVGAETFSVKDAAAGSIVSIASGDSYSIYLKTNATAAGTWGYWQAGAGSSTVDAAAIDGAGLEASSGLLRVKKAVVSYSASQAFSDNDRGKLAKWTGGSGTFTMPSPASVGDGWSMEFKNDGSGTLQIAAPASETFDGESDITLAAGEGCLVASDGTNFSYISSSGSATTSDFSYTAIAVAGTGTYTLNASEYANRAIKFTGILTGNRVVVVPAAVAEFWVNNATTGAYTLTVKTAAGSGVAVTQTKSAILYCDGTDVVAAETDEGAGISTPVAIADGGTGAITAPLALTALGGTTVGVQVFTAANAAAVRSAAGAAASGANTDLTSIYLNNTGLKIKDTNASHGLSLVPGSDLTADRVLTLTTGDAARTLSLSGNLTIAGTTTISAYGATLVDDADASAARTTLGLAIGTNVQAYDAELAAIAGLTSAADRVPYFTGSGAAALATFTTFGRSLVDDADAATARTTLGVVNGSWVTIGTLTPSAVASVEQGSLSGYDAIRITGRALRPATDNVTFAIRLSSDGATYLSTNYDVTVRDNNSANSTTSFNISDPAGTNNIGSAAGDGALDFSITLTSFNAAQKTKCMGHFVYGDASGSLIKGSVRGWHSGQTAMQALQFAFSSGNITSGSITIEGLA